jgi:hypothetical protein
MEETLHSNERIHGFITADKSSRKIIGSHVNIFQLLYVTIT